MNAKNSDRNIHSWCMLVSALGLVSAAAAQDYPDKPIRMIVPVLPGGAPDFGGRIVAERLSLRLGQKVVVENRAGAGGIIGLEVLKTSPANGYIIATTQLGPLTVSPLIQEGLSYDPLRDFTHITNLLTFPLLMVSHSSLPAKNVKELIALARASGTGNLRLIGRGRHRPHRH